jgi:hypothetical protein
MFPVVGADRDFVERVVALIDNPDVSPVVGRSVLDRADQLKRMLTARGE